MYSKLIAAFAVLFPVSALAGPTETFQLANDLGTLLGSEAECGFSYDHDAIASWIDNKTDPAEMSFTSILDGMTTATEYKFDGMSPSAKVAHCRSVERTAKHYHFLK